MDVRRKFKGFDLVFEDFVFREHIIQFSWELADEELSRNENQKKSSFSDTLQVWTTTPNPLPFWGQRQCWGNIGNPHFGCKWIQGERPQHVVALDCDQNARLNTAQVNVGYPHPSRP